jgi:alpha-L-fucosidase
MPVTDVHAKAVRLYVEDDPVPEYRWASDPAYEAFRDMKYGIRIHWGLYSLAGFTAESWPFLNLNYAQRAHYNQTYKTWNPVGFDADEWTSLFAENGLRMFAFTTNTMKDSRCSIHKRV